LFYLFTLNFIYSLPTRRSSDLMSKKIAYLDYFKAKHGVFLGMRRVSIGGQPIVPPSQKKKIFWRYNYLLNQLYFSAFHADGENRSEEHTSELQSRFDLVCRILR